MAKKGENWKSELYLVQNAEKSGYLTFTGDNLYDELKKYLKFDEVIEQVLAYKTKLSEVQVTKLILYHMFIVFKTKGCWYSIEKNSEGITLQRSSNEEILLKRSRDGERKPGLHRMKKDSGSKTVGEVIKFIFKENLLNKAYNYLDENCQGFGKDIFNFVARSEHM